MAPLGPVSQARSVIPLHGRRTEPRSCTRTSPPPGSSSVNPDGTGTRTSPTALSPTGSRSRSTPIPGQRARRRSAPRSPPPTTNAPRRTARTARRSRSRLAQVLRRPRSTSRSAPATPTASRPQRGIRTLDAIVGAPGGPDDADVGIQVFIDDVFTNALADYGGEVRGHLTLRITDKDNTPHPAVPAPAPRGDPARCDRALHRHCRPAGGFGCSATTTATRSRPAP